MTDTGGPPLYRIEFGMEWPPGHVACYLLAGAEPVLFDAGMPGAILDGTAPAETLRAGLTDAGHDLADVAHLVVTHPHVDHIGQVPAVVEAADPTVYAPAGVRERFARDADAVADRVRANARAAGLTDDGLERAVGDAVESLERDRDLLAPERVDEWVAPGAVSFGPVAATAIHTPGHQADHLAYLLADGRLVSGDTVLAPFRAVLLHDGLDDGYREAFDAYYAGLDRLAAHDPDRVYPGHGPVHDRFHELLDRDRRSLDRRLDAVASLVRDGHETASAVAETLAGERPTRYVLAEAMSALTHLDAEGRIEAPTGARGR